MKHRRTIILFCLLSAAFSTAVSACLNDSELATREREFRSTYLTGSEPIDEGFWYTGPSEETLRQRLAVFWWLGLASAVAAAGVSVIIVQRARSKTWILCLPFVVIGICISVFVGVWWNVINYQLPIPTRTPFLAESFPLPHHVPPRKAGLSFRFQLVHDVLRERFLRHGEAWYEARNKDIQRQLKQLPASDPTSRSLIDDLAVGYDRMGQPQKAIPILRDKLNQQQSQAVPFPQQYTTLANLGTVLIHSGLMKQQASETGVQEEGLNQFSEGVEWIRKAVEANPDAHFGRELWQLKIAEFLLQALKEPDLLKTTDCLGNKLDLDIEEILNRGQNWCSECPYGRPNVLAFTKDLSRQTNLPAAFDTVKDLGRDDRWEELSPVREYVTPVGYELLSYEDKVAFDRPMLGIIGMWREGGGANPHFSLAIAETMLRVGQRYLAWDAYERTIMLADRYSADEQIRDFLLAHCRQRQQDIETTWQFRDDEAWRGPRAYNPAWQVVSPPPEPAAVSDLATTFRQNLEAASEVRNEYVAFENAELAAGVPWKDVGFDRFEGRFPEVDLAGAGEQVTIVLRKRWSDWNAVHLSAWMMLTGGAGALVIALALLWVQRCRHTKADSSTTEISHSDAEIQN